MVVKGMRLLMRVKDKMERQIYIDEKTQEAKDLLKTIKRKGMSKLIKYMEEGGFFKAPASTKWHGVYRGGLLIHSYNVYKEFLNHCNKYNINFSIESIIICAFGHDLCKMGMYVELDEGKYGYTGLKRKYHSILSIERLKKYIELTPEEETIIRFHMGIYGTTEFDSKYGEYNLKELTDAYNKNKLAKLFYFCDDIASMFLEKK